MRAGTAGLVVATLACLVPRAAVPRNPEPALIEIEPMTNALAVGEVTRVEDDATFCAFVRGAPCDDPSWFLTSTGREALLAAVTIDNLNRRMTLAHVSGVAVTVRSSASSSGGIGS